MHRFHAGLTDYDSANVFHDGCEECEARVRDLRTLLSYTDGENIARLWHKMVAARKGEFRDGPRSDADVIACNQLELVAVFIAKFGPGGINPWLEDWVEV